MTRAALARAWGQQSSGQSNPPQQQEIGTAETARSLLGPRLPPCTWFHDSQSKSLFDAHVGADALVCPVERSSAALPVWQLACGVRLLVSESPPPSGARCRSSFTTHWAARTLSAIRHSAATRTTASAVPISCRCAKVLSTPLARLGIRGRLPLGGSRRLRARAPMPSDPSGNMYCRSILCDPNQ